MLLGIGCHLRIQNIWQDLCGEIYHCHIDAFCLQILCRLQADKAGSNDDRSLHTFFINICADSIRVIRRTHLEHACQILSRNGKLRCGRAYGDHQFVIGTDLLTACEHVFHRDLFLCRIQRHCLFACPYLHSSQPGILLRRVDDQLISSLDQPSYIIRKSASRIGNVLILCNYCYFCASVLSFQLCSRLCTGCYSADDQYFHRSLLPEHFRLNP